jgi:hypothetical protein
MENGSPVELKCYCCKSVYKESDKFCGKCGYPFQGSLEEKKQFSLNYASKSFDKDIARSRIMEARIILFVISAFTVISAIIISDQDPTGIILIINLIIAGIFAGLGFLAGKKAFAAIFTGSLIYFSILILTAILDPTTIFHGIVFKVLFTIALIKASYSSYRFKISKME